MLAGTTPTSAFFDAGSATATIEVDTVGDDTDEADSKITVTLATGDGYKLGTNDQSEAATTILDDDAAALPGGTVAVAGTVVWTADMTVTDYGTGTSEPEPRTCSRTSAAARACRPGTSTTTPANRSCG